MQEIVIGKWAKVCWRFFALTMPLVLSGCIGAGVSTSSSSGVNVSGTWNLFQPAASSVTFIQIGNELTVNGTANAGTVNGQSITFSAAQSDGSTITYTGTVTADVTSMSGSFTSTSGATGSWNASLAPATITISGTWNVFNTPTNSTLQGPNAFTFTQTGNTLTGTTPLSSQPVTGTVSGLSIQFTWIASGGSTNIYIGTVSADGTSMFGIYTTGSVQSGTWNATQTSSPTTVDVTGKWNVFQTPANSTETALGLFTFTQTGSSMTGSSPQGNSVGGTVTGQGINFSWLGNDGSSNLYVGTISTDGLTMTGTYISSTTTSSQQGTWRATKSSS